MAYTGGGKKDPNNRLSTSDSLNTSAIWQKAIKYDPYAPEGTNEAALDEGGINDRAKGLFELARITGVSKEKPPGACKKCGQVGHLAFQCRNLLKLEASLEAIQEAKNDEEEDDPDSMSESSSSSSSSDSSPKKKKKKKSKKKKVKKKKVKKKDKRKKEEVATKTKSKEVDSTHKKAKTNDEDEVDSFGRTKKRNMEVARSRDRRGTPSADKNDNNRGLHNGRRTKDVDYRDPSRRGDINTPRHDEARQDRRDKSRKDESRHDRRDKSPRDESRRERRDESRRDESRRDRRDDSRRDRRDDSRGRSRRRSRSGRKKHDRGSRSPSIDEGDI
eukprot:GEMP01072114.1.p1 GENE.GEMP01072114.1~~GEMP01072114.1.p1  ORF type:complete len:331 (+),score=90.56 GEMP01072114.1:87-1079(+)